MSVVANKLKEVLRSVLPVTIIVILLHLTIAPLSTEAFINFLIGSVFVIIGLTIFLIGVDNGIEPIGHRVGSALTRAGSLLLLVAVGLTIGFFISYAEPDLHILASQVAAVTSGQFPARMMVSVVSAGIAVMMTLGLLRIVRNFPLKYSFLIIYGLIFALMIFASEDFQAIAFDASGATTGALTVPFMLALAAGVSALKRDSLRGEADSFGLVGISSGGAILGVLITGMILGVDKLNGSLPEPSAHLGGLSAFFSHIPAVALETMISLLPILVAYLLFQLIAFRQSIRHVLNTLRGLMMTYIGLLLFLTGVKGGFMETGSQVGVSLAANENYLAILTISFVLGLVTVLAEPAVMVLTNQVEDITGGYVRRRLVLIALSLAVGAAIAMSALRILIPGLRLWMYLVPGFGLTVVLAFFIPDLFTGIAYDSGGVASGPMTATFSMAFVQGVAAHVPTADVVTDGFGMIAIVAMMPILAIELLGLSYRIKTRQRK